VIKSEASLADREPYAQPHEGGWFAGQPGSRTKKQNHSTTCDADFECGPVVQSPRLTLPPLALNFERWSPPFDTSKADLRRDVALCQQLNAFETIGNDRISAPPLSSRDPLVP
jgi:hypothetical protein